MKPKDLELKIVRTIKFIRIAKNLKQINLARALQISESNYSKIESGKKALSITQLKLIADYFETIYIQIIVLAEIRELTEDMISPIVKMLIECSVLIEKNNIEFSISKDQLDRLINDFRAIGRKFEEIKVGIV